MNHQQIIDFLKGLKTGPVYEALEKTRRDMVESRIDNLRVPCRSQEDFLAAEHEKGYLSGLEVNLVDLTVKRMEEKGG